MSDEKDDTNELTLKTLVRTLDKNFSQEERRLDQDKKTLIFSKVKFFLIAVFFAIVSIPSVTSMYKAYIDGSDADNDYAAVVKLDGPIMPNTRNSAESVIATLEKAFEDDEAKGIVLLVNSPGGTPVQSALIADHIIRLRKEYPEKKIITVAEDVIASGAYMAAMGTDEIYAHRSTIAGSIGVVSEGFGYQNIIKMVGLERRVQTAGSHKRRLDPFFPLKQSDMVVLDQRLKAVHAQFIALVKKSRGDKLKAEDDYLFNGDVWTGEEALALGLIDGISDIDSIIRKKFGVTKYKDMTAPVSFVDQLTGSIKKQVSLYFTESSLSTIKVMMH